MNESTTICSMKARTISHLEQAVMNLVWSSQEASVREIMTLLSVEKPVAYTTVLTVLQRLYEKGLVTRKQTQKAYHYSPKISKESYSKTLAQNFIQKFFQSFGEIGITSFAQSIDSLSKTERDHLLSLLEQYEKNK